MNAYKTLIFDCDGVVLNSNKIKTEAFYQTTYRYGEAGARAMVDYHKANGGISRYEKFEYFAKIILPSQGNLDPINTSELLEDYALNVKRGLLNCDIAPNLEKLRQQTKNTRWFIVSGGDQVEIREIFKTRGICDYFDGGIYGSPTNKYEIMTREIQFCNIQSPAIYYGDSKYDYEVAKRMNIDFVFISGWTEVDRWRQWVKVNKIEYKTHL